MGFHELCRPLAGDALPHLAEIVGREGALTLPVCQCGLHLGIGGPEVFPLGHHQKAQTAPQLLLCLCMELSAELFHGLAPHLEILVKVDVVGLQPQVEVPLFSKIVAGDQVLGQGALDTAAQLEDKLPAGQCLGLRTALGIELPCHLLAQSRFACGIGGAVFIAVPGVHFQLNAHLPDGPGLDGLGEAGVTLQLQRRQAVELCPRPEALGPVDGQQFKIRIGHGHQMLFFHKLLI